jgi:hypothetical protein
MHIPQALHEETTKLKANLSELEKERQVLLQEKREWDQVKALFEAEKQQLMDQISRSRVFVESREAEVDAVKDVLQRGHKAIDEVILNVCIQHVYGYKCLVPPRSPDGAHVMWLWSYVMQSWHAVGLLHWLVSSRQHYLNMKWV